MNAPALAIPAELHESVARRLWAAIDRKPGNACWEHHATAKSGWRPRIGVDSHYYYAYRVAWVLTNGPIPAGLLVCHRCDNPACCRPDHLFLGTVLDNALDARDKGRIVLPEPRRGLANNMATVADERIDEAQHLYATGRFSQKALAKRYGVGQSTIGRWMRAVARTDQPTRKLVRSAPCGTRAGYCRHRKDGDGRCEPCWRANADYMREYKRARRLVGDPR